jgi:hypothetical protein
LYRECAGQIALEKEKMPDRWRSKVPDSIPRDVADNMTLAGVQFGRRRPVQIPEAPFSSPKAIAGPLLSFALQHLHVFLMYSYRFLMP